MSLSKVYGIDVSHYQKGLKLKNAIEEGFSYIIIKAGGADKGYYTDPLFKQFYEQAQQAHFENIGAYYFGQAFSINDAIKEANMFLSLIHGTNIKKVYYDVEGRMMNQSPVNLTNIIKAFCDTVNSVGYVCGVYSSEYYFNNGMIDKELKKYPHWVAKYSRNEPKLNSGIACEIWQYGGTTNLIRNNKVAGIVTDQNFIYTPWTKAIKEKTEVSAVKVKDATYDTIHNLALEVLDGKYGTGEIRKKALGVYHSAVQAEVNAILQQRAEKPVEKTTEQLANEVLAGMWGNGLMRKIKLGKSYAEVQACVEKLVNERNAKGFKYTVVKGDTLSSIAKKYNTTVAKLLTINDISDPNKIWVGQMLDIS